jgi:hypothetical protein
VRIAEQIWSDVDASLEQRGDALLPDLLSPDDCAAFREDFEDDSRFRKTIEMGRHAYGDGRYRYYTTPLPEGLSRVRESLYEQLVPIAHAWHERLAIDERFPAHLPEFLERCHAAGQRRPTPLVLRYEKDGYNRMHQDRYGDVAFPLQVTCLLSDPNAFQGGEFLVSENRPRMQVKTEAIPLALGEGIVFANTIRPVESARGYARANMRHGMNRLRGGVRYALGVIFHDAE